MAAILRFPLSIEEDELAASCSELGGDQVSNIMAGGFLGESNLNSDGFESEVSDEDDWTPLPLAPLLGKAITSLQRAALASGRVNSLSALGLNNRAGSGTVSPALLIRPGGTFPGFDEDNTARGDGCFAKEKLELLNAREAVQDLGF